MRRKGAASKQFLTLRVLPRPGARHGSPLPCLHPTKLQVLGSEHLILRDQADGVLQDASQQAAVSVLSVRSLLCPQLSPGLEHLYPWRGSVSSPPRASTRPDPTCSPAARGVSERGQLAHAAHRGHPGPVRQCRAPPELPPAGALVPTAPGAIPAVPWSPSGERHRLC